MTDSLSPQALLNINYRDTGTLKPNLNNARKHPKSQIRLIANSLQRFGWVTPLIIDPDDMILCGHGRYEAALLLGMTSVPTIMLEHLSEADRRAYVIMDNASAEQAGWSDKMLATELSGLLEIGYDLEFTGLSQLRIDTILSMDGPVRANAPFCKG